MKIMNRNSAPRYRRDQIESFLLVSELTCQSKHLAVSLVEMQPGGIQHIHAHDPEQMYFILEGSGIMTIDGESKPVKAGDVVFYPSRAAHGLQNTGDTVLKYISAASPSFNAEECKDLWPLPSLAQETLNNGRKMG